MVVFQLVELLVLLPKVRDSNSFNGIEYYIYQLKLHFVAPSHKLDFLALKTLTTFYHSARSVQEIVSTYLGSAFVNF